MNKLFEFIEHLGRYRVLVQTCDIRNGAVTKEKIEDGAVSNEKLKDLSISWNKLSADVQNIIASREEGGVALSMDFGDSELVGITQKRLTEAYMHQEETNRDVSESISNIENVIGSGGNIDERISEAVSGAKSELIGGASEKGNTLKKLEDKIQSEREGVNEELADRYTKEETYSKEQLNNLITTPEQQYVSVGSYDDLPETGAADTIYRVGGTTSYSEYAWNGENYVKLSEKNPGIDDEPTADSNNLVKSRGVFEFVRNTEQSLLNVIDKLRNAGYAFAGIATVETDPGAPFGDCFYIAEKAGTYVNFRNADDEPIVISADGIYVITYEADENQYWEYDLVVGIDDAPTAESDHLVRSKGVFEAIRKADGIIDISILAAVDGIPHKYNSLTAVLTAANILLSEDQKKGGMSIKFIKTTAATYNVIKGSHATGTQIPYTLTLESGIYAARDIDGVELPTTVNATVSYYYSDGTDVASWTITKITDDKDEYEQYRLMATAWSTEADDWQGVVNEIKEKSRNPVESGVVYACIIAEKSRAEERETAIEAAVINVKNKAKASNSYYECTTEASTAEKVVSATDYVLSVGGSIKIKMTNANAASNPTLNVNSTGAKPLYYDGKPAAYNNTWEAGETVEVYYDGTNFYANNVAGNGTFATGEKIKGIMLEDVPEAESGHLVKSGGVFQAINNAHFSTNEKLKEVGIDNIPTAKSNNLVRSRGVYEAIAAIEHSGIDNILNVVEDGFYLIDESYNIGGYENAQGGNLINGGESSSDIAYDVIN